jgi:hypothetical protein
MLGARCTIYLMRRHVDLICWTLAAVVLSIHTAQHAHRRREERTRLEAEQAAACTRAAVNAERRIHIRPSVIPEHRLGDFPLGPRRLGLAHGTYPMYLLGGHAGARRYDLDRADPNL